MRIRVVSIGRAFKNLKRSVLNIIKKCHSSGFSLSSTGQTVSTSPISTSSPSKRQNPRRIRRKINRSPCRRVKLRLENQLISGIKSSLRIGFTRAKSLRIRSGTRGLTSATRLCPSFPIRKGPKGYCKKIIQRSASRKSQPTMSLQLILKLATMGISIVPNFRS